MVIPLQTQSITPSGGSISLNVEDFSEFHIITESATTLVADVTIDISGEAEFGSKIKLYLNVDLDLNGNTFTLFPSEIGGNRTMSALELSSPLQIEFIYGIDNKWTLVIGGMEASSGSVYTTTSTTSRTISHSTASINLVVADTGLSYTIGQSLIVAYDADNYFIGRVSSYSGNVLNLDIYDYYGTGTYSAWVINLVGESGVDGDRYTSTSNSPWLISDSDTKSFYIGLDYAYSEGQSVVAAYDSNNYGVGTIVEYIDGYVTIAFSSIVGSGYYSDWKISITGLPGIKGDRYTTTSTTSWTLAGSGTQTFEVDSGLAYVPGQSVVVSYDSTKYATGTVNSYSVNDLDITFSALVGSGGPYTSWSISLSAGAGAAGDVVGPSSSTDNAIARYDNTTGKLIQNSTATISDTGDMSVAGDINIASGKVYKINSTQISSSALSDSASIVTLTGSQTLTNKGLTTPFITDPTLLSPILVNGILDINSKIVLTVTPTVSAVNGLNITNAISGGIPILGTAGSDTNIDLNIKPKGTGKIQINGSTAKIDTILDEDNMSSNDENALATQQSIKKYVDDNKLWEVSGETQLISPDTIDLQKEQIVNVSNPDTPNGATVKSIVETLATTNNKMQFDYPYNPTSGFIVGSSGIGNTGTISYNPVSKKMLVVSSYASSPAFWGTPYFCVSSDGFNTASTWTDIGISTTTATKMFGGYTSGGKFCLFYSISTDLYSCYTDDDGDTWSTPAIIAPPSGYYVAINYGTNTILEFNENGNDTIAVPVVYYKLTSNTLSYGLLKSTSGGNTFTVSGYTDEYSDSTHSQQCTAQLISGNAIILQSSILGAVGDIRQWITYDYGTTWEYQGELGIDPESIGGYSTRFHVSLNSIDVQGKRVIALYFHNRVDQTYKRSLCNPEDLAGSNGHASWSTPETITTLVGKTSGEFMSVHPNNSYKGIGFGGSYSAIGGQIISGFSTTIDKDTVLQYTHPSSKDSIINYGFTAPTETPDKIADIYIDYEKSDIYTSNGSSYAKIADKRWNKVLTNTYTATPAETDQINMSDTTGMVTGLPLKYTYDGNTYYGIIESVTTNTNITISGFPLDTGEDLTDLYVGQPELVVNESLIFSGVFGPQDYVLGDSNGMLYTYLKLSSHFKWLKSNAKLVAVEGEVFQADSTNNPSINIGIKTPGGSWNEIFTSDLIITTTTANTGVTAGTDYSISYGSNLDVSLTSVGAVTDAEDMQLTLTFILE